MKVNVDRLSGVFVPVVTPFGDGEIRYDSLRRNLRALGRTGVAGYLALGSNGEFRSLDEAEQDRLLSIFAEEKAGKVLMAGTGCESTTQTVARSRRAAALGADYASVLTPAYFAKQMTSEALKRHYCAVADQSPIPVLLYHAPQFAGGVQLSAAVVAELARHPNIHGMKDSASAGPMRFLSVLPGPAAFAVLAGSATFFYPALHVGAVGGVLSLANAIPAECVRLYRLFVDGRHEEARDVHAKLVRLTDASSGKHGVAGVKALMDMAGMEGGEPRLPLLPLQPDEADRLRAALTAEGY